MSVFEPAETISSPARMEALINGAFKREVIRKVTDVILPLNDVGVGPPFYCVHPLSGAVTEYQHMVRMLGSRQNFYGIQAPTNRRNSQFGRSIKEISRYYVDELMKFQPKGAFFLGGHSVGATIALEMAHQLIARGREVSLLVVFDGELFNTGAEISWRNPLYWLKVLLNAPRWTVDELVKNRQKFASKWRARLKSLVLRGRLNPGSHPAESAVNLNGFLPEHAAFVRALYDDYLDYVPGNYSGRVLVFVAKTEALFRLRQVRAAWTKIAPSSEIFETNGTHLGIMRVPHGLPIAQRLGRKIEEVFEGPN